MIKLVKGPKPLVLEEKENTWRDEYLKLKAGDQSIPAAAKNRYGHPDIKKAVKEEAHEKCIYCESKISHIHPGEIDHLLPRSKMPELVVDWHNLAYVCRNCNSYKLDYHDVNYPLLNPFNDDPKEHLHILGPLVIAKPADTRGNLTVERIKLSRAELVERRTERIKFVKALLDSCAALPEGPARDELTSIAAHEANPEKEYSATVRAFLDIVE